MNENYMISFKESDQKVLVLIIFKKAGFLEPVVDVVKVFTGPEAENMYRKITKNTIRSSEFKK